MLRFWVLLMILFECGEEISAQTSPNFVVFLTDDQDLLLDGLKPLTKTLELIANNGATFINAIVNSPVCCPSRSTFLTGKYAHTLGVRNNSISGNCSSPEWQSNFESQSIASILKTEANYRTFYAGKYLNQYGSKKAGGLGHVPPGYDWWLGLEGNSRYYNYTLSVNGSRKSYENEYLTDLIKSSALDFLNVGDNLVSFFMMLAPPAPHAPFTPAPRHRNAFENTKCVKTPSFNYTSSDKHWIVEMFPNRLPGNVDILDDIQRGRLQTLLAVDEMVEAVVSKLSDLEILNQTYLIFTSDNGFHIGQFSQPWDKRQPYDTDIRVPLLISGPKVPRKVLIDYPVAFVDLAPTILDLAGLESIESDGISFKNRLFGMEIDEILKRKIFIEYWGEGNPNSVDLECRNLQDDRNNLAECSPDSWCKCQDSRNNTYVCVVDFDDLGIFKFCRFSGDFYEAYNLTKDPSELENIYKNLDKNTRISYDLVLDQFENCNSESCRKMSKI